MSAGYDQGFRFWMRGGRRFGPAGYDAPFGGYHPGMAPSRAGGYRRDFERAGPRWGDPRTWWSGGSVRGGFEPRIHRYDDGFGYRMREGWHDLERGVRRVLHRGYDRRW